MSAERAAVEGAEAALQRLLVRVARAPALRPRREPVPVLAAGQPEVAAHQFECWTTTLDRRSRTARGCGRPAEGAEHPSRPWYPCARSACPVCRVRSCRPFAPQ